MTAYAILIAVEVTTDANGTSSTAANASRAIDSARLCLTQVHALPPGQIQELRDDSQPITADNVTTAFNNLPSTLADDDTIIAMFAGHGRADEHENFLGWALSGPETYTPALLWAQYDRYPSARWIVLSNCCYGAAINPIKRSGLRAYRLVRALLAEFLGAGQDDPFRRLVNSTLEQTASSHTLGKLPESLVTLAGATPTGLVDDLGEMLFATLVVGCSLGKLSYRDLKTSFDLTSKYGQAFDCDVRDKSHDKVVLT